MGLHISAFQITFVCLQKNETETCVYAPSKPALMVQVVNIYSVEAHIADCK